MFLNGLVKRLIRSNWREYRKREERKREERREEKRGEEMGR
jgi:hypothetical protein